MYWNLYRVPSCENEVPAINNNCIVDNAVFLNINNMESRLKEVDPFVFELERTGVCEMSKL